MTNSFVSQVIGRELYIFTNINCSCRIISPVKTIQIVLFSSSKTYANTLSQANIDPSSIQSIVTNSGGLTVDTTIWIPLYNLADNSDLANVLSHELFHACASSQGYGDQLPTWINEGTAWRIGLTAMQKVNPQKASLEMTYFEVDVRNAAKKGILLPLTALENDILNAQYNIEYEDFMAVEQLVKQHGTSTYKTFIQNLKTEKVGTDFQYTFNTTIDNFSEQFHKNFTSSEPSASEFHQFLSFRDSAAQFVYCTSSTKSTWKAICPNPCSFIIDSLLLKFFGSNSKISKVGPLS